MQQSLFFDGQKLLLDDVANVETTKTTEILRRVVDISTQTGIIGSPGGGTITPTANGAFNIDISAGVAYDSNGEYINIAAPTTQAFGSGDAGKYIVARYASNDGSLRAHPITGALNNTRRTDSYTTAIVTTPAATDVILGRITAIDGSNVATIDLDVRVYWSARIAPDTITDDMLDQDGDVITHIHSLGTGTVTPTNVHGLSPADIGFTPDTTPTVHQQKDHTTGFEPASDADVAAVTVNSATAPDSLDVQQTGASDSYLINGTRYSGTNLITPSTSITFGDGTVNPALYEIVLLSSGALLKSARAQYGAAKNITGVQVVDVSSDHAAGARVLSFTVATKKLKWDNGGEVPLDAPAGSFNGDAFYVLRRDAGSSSQTITVWVDYSALPVGDQTDSITINTTAVTSSNLHLANVPWSGTATGFLGYGDHNTSGAALDKRQFGNLAMDNIHALMKNTEFYRRFQDGHGDGIVWGGSGDSGGGLNFDIAHTIAYVGGKMYDIPEQTVALTDASFNYLYLDVAGTWQVSTTDPALLRPNDLTFQSPPQAPFVYGFLVQTAGGVITNLRDWRRLFPKTVEPAHYSDNYAGESRRRVLTIDKNGLIRQNDAKTGRGVDILWLGDPDANGQNYLGLRRNSSGQLAGAYENAPGIAVETESDTDLDIRVNNLDFQGSGSGFDVTGVTGTITNRFSFSQFEHLEFTPAIQVDASAANVQVNTAVGYYSRMGNFVFFHVYVYWSWLVGGGSVTNKTLTITNLPLPPFEPQFQLESSAYYPILTNAYADNSAINGRARFFASTPASMMLYDSSATSNVWSLTGGNDYEVAVSGIITGFNQF